MIRMHVEGGDGVVRVGNFPLLCWAFSAAHGIWWIGCGRGRLLLRGPRCKPLFSERNGLQRGIVRLGFGWRVCAFRIRHREVWP